jgi:hypothetical protein
VRWQKVLGLAAFAGVAATGVVIARAERRRRSYTPQQIRERLHERLAEAAEASAASQPAPSVDAVRSARITRLRQIMRRTRPKPG